MDLRILPVMTNDTAAGYRAEFDALIADAAKLDPAKIREDMALEVDDIPLMPPPAKHVDMSEPGWFTPIVRQGRREAYEKLALGEDINDGETYYR